MNTPQSRGGTISAARAWFTVTVLMLAYALAMVDRTILFLMVAPLEHDLHISDTQMGLLQGFAFSIFFAVAGIPLGRLADLKSRRRIIGVGIVLWSLMTALSGLAQRFWELFIARMGVGIGEATLSPAAYSLMADLFSKDRLARAIALFSAGSLIGAGAAFVFGGVVLGIVGAHPVIALSLIGEVRSWQIAFFIAAFPGLFVALLTLAIPEPTRAGPGQKVVVPLKALTKFLVDARYPLICYALGFSSQTLVIYSTMSWGPTLLARKHHVETASVGAIMGVVVGVFGLAGFFAGGALADYFSRTGRADGHMRVGLIGALCFGPFAVAMTLSHSISMTVACMCLLFFFITLPTAAGVAGLQLTTPSRLRAQVSSIFLLIVNLVGLGLGSLVIGGLTDYVFKNKSAIDLSLLTMYVAVMPLMIASFWLGKAPVAAWIIRQEKAR